MKVLVGNQFGNQGCVWSSSFHEAERDDKRIWRQMIYWDEKRGGAGRFRDRRLQLPDSLCPLRVAGFIIKVIRQSLVHKRSRPSWPARSLRIGQKGDVQ